MRSEPQLYYDTFRRRVLAREFSDPDPEICECHGGGWFLSEVDTWHKCPCHPNMPHPEDYEYDREWREANEGQLNLHVWAWELYMANSPKNPFYHEGEDDVPF